MFVCAAWFLMRLGLRGERRALPTSVKDVVARCGRTPRLAASCTPPRVDRPSAARAWARTVVPVSERVHQSLPAGVCLSLLPLPALSLRPAFVSVFSPRAGAGEGSGMGTRIGASRRRGCQSVSFSGMTGSVRGLPPGEGTRGRAVGETRGAHAVGGWKRPFDFPIFRLLSYCFLRGGAALE
jgi:hypothetical protein